MSKVVALGNGALPDDSGAYPEVIELLEELLAEARRGEIESLATVKRRPNGHVSTKFTASCDRHHLLAGAVYLQHDLNKDA